MYEDVKDYFILYRQIILYYTDISQAQATQQKNNTYNISNKATVKIPA